VEVKKAVPHKPAAVSVAIVTFKLVGEAWGFASALLGSGAAVYVWFAGREARTLLKKPAVFFPFLEAKSASFTGGAALILEGFLYGALALLLGYLLAELLQLLPVRLGSEAAAREKIG
jgi:hypothetical protein